MIEKDNKKTIRSWAFFDWANSAYNLVITSTIFPVYYVAITTTKEHGDEVTFFGKTFINTVLSNYALALAYLVMVVLLPLLSSYADAKGKKKFFMQLFTYVGSIACMGLFFFDLAHLELGIICFVLAAMGYVGGVMFNNSYLPIIASVDKQDKVSAQGFAYGYIGSVILQLVCFVFVLKPGLFGIAEKSALPAQISFLLVGIWWLAFAQIPFKVLPRDKPSAGSSGKGIIKSSFGEFVKVWNQLKLMKFLKTYLIAFFAYSMGVQTIMLAAAGFGAKVLKLESGSLIAVILIIQLVAILGAWLMSLLAKKVGNINVLSGVVVVWITCCVLAYFINNSTQFYALAAVVGLIMGGIQSLSRSTYSKHIPENTTDTASFFSFYDATEKLAIVLGLFSFALIEGITHDMRKSIIALASFFVIGLVFLLILKKIESKEAVKL
ncbi:MFS transporter [Pedobacter aquatilis]|uniref:MFS transporter n=1 Tax=Pedobacter aquatilis TaxID=351343 RepID=UPI00292D8E47|nr:MFS transporter [Pedobacter aquatilis]